MWYSTNPFYLGGTCYWMQKYDFDSFIEYNRRYRTTVQMSVPPIWLQIAKSPKVTDHFDSVEVCLNEYKGTLLSSKHPKCGCLRYLLTFFALRFLGSRHGCCTNGYGARQRGQRETWERKDTTSPVLGHHGNMWQYVQRSIFLSEESADTYVHRQQV